MRSARSISTRAASSSRSSRHERFRPGPQEPVPQQAARRPDDRLDPGGVHDLRRAREPSSTAFTADEDRSAADRLVTVNKINFTQPLPIAYYNRVRAVQGVRAGHPRQLVRRLLPGPQERADRHGGRARDLHGNLQHATSIFQPRCGRPSCATAPARWSARRWRASGAGRSATTCRSSSNIFTQQNGSHTWDIHDRRHLQAPERPAGRHQLRCCFQYAYFDETRSFGKDTIGWLVLRDRVAVRK